MNTIQDLLHMAVSRYGTRVAFMEPGGDGEMNSLTYEDLLVRAQNFGGALQERRLEKGDCILLWCASCIDWMVAFLGAMLIGVVIVPLDTNSREDFLSKIEESTEARYLVTS